MNIVPEFDVGAIVFGWDPSRSIGIVLNILDGGTREVYFYKSSTGDPATEFCSVRTLLQNHERAVEMGYLRP